MNEPDNNRTISCPACGAESSDLEWCENCGASLTGQEGEVEKPDKLWLEAGDTVSFNLPKRSVAPPAGDFTQKARRQQQTRRDLPRLKTEPPEREAPTADEPARNGESTKSAFEVIGPTGDDSERDSDDRPDDSESHDDSSQKPESDAEETRGADAGKKAEDDPADIEEPDAEDAEEPDAEDAEEPDAQEAEEPDAKETKTERASDDSEPDQDESDDNQEESANSSAAEEGTGDSPDENAFEGSTEVSAGPDADGTAGNRVTVEVESVREAYSQRRLWDVVDVDSDTKYVLEERRLAPNEAPSRAVEFQPVDELTDRWVFNMLARKAHQKRILTLFEAPQGVSLEAWRRDGGDEAATADAIIKMLRPIVEAMEAIHSKHRLHLHLNPRTVWIDGDDVGFTGIDRLETIPVQGNRFRATVGFSAPELFGRSKQKIDTHADIYSLGAITFYLITGIIPPVAPETAFAPAIGARDFRPAFPIGWSEVILKATDPVPNRRYGSAAAFLSALEGGFGQMKVRRRFDEDVRYFAAAERHIGFSKQQRSPINQDNVFVGHDKQRNRMLLAVADGVSTASFGSGDLASGFLANRAEEAWNTLQGDEDKDPVEIINGILHMSNQDIVDYVNDKHSPLTAPPSEVMGSTALIAWVEDGIMTLASLGDSRCYLIRPEMMECVTRDHNLFTLSLIEGLGIDEVLFLPHGDALARCLGTFDVGTDGYLTAVDPPADFYQLRLIPGDNLLLCTDGLFDYAGSTYEESEAHIRRRVLADTHPGLACLELILLANRGGGGDNIGVALLKVMPESGLHQ